MRREKDGLLRCCRCGEYKPLEEFCHDRTKSHGRASACKPCKSLYEKDYQAKYYLKNKEELLPKHRESAKRSYKRRNESLNRL